MTLEVANILGLNYAYVILASELRGHEVIIVNPIFTSLKAAEACAKEYENKHNFQVYTEIHKLEVK